MRTFHLTRRAFMDLEEIYYMSVERLSVKVAKGYLEDIYMYFQKIANQPELGLSKKARSGPFLIYPARKHFVIYENMWEQYRVVTPLL